MSLASWKKEFYPIPASKTSKRSAVAHSLRKWTGLTKANLKKHGLEACEATICEKNDEYEEMQIESDSCALCHHYLGDISFNALDYCANCPLYKVRGNVSCDQRKVAEYAAPYVAFLDTGDARPMLKWLKKCV